MKKVLGIISIVLFFLIAFQSCAAGLGNAMEGSTEASGTTGFLLVLCWLIGGIIELPSKNSKGAVITGIVFYGLGGVLGIANVGSYKDLKIWAILFFYFCRIIDIQFS